MVDQRSPRWTRTAARQGTPTEEEIFVTQCAACHGDFGGGRDRWPTLVGGAAV